MKFLLKISTFMGLILISKLTKQTEQTTSATGNSELTHSALTIYRPQSNLSDKPEKAIKKKEPIFYY